MNLKKVGNFNGWKPKYYNTYTINPIYPRAANLRQISSSKEILSNKLFKTIDNYRLCIVHTGLKKHVLLTYKEYESLIQNKRVQYQINFKSKN